MPRIHFKRFNEAECCDHLEACQQVYFDGRNFFSFNLIHV